MLRAYFIKKDCHIRGMHYVVFDDGANGVGVERALFSAAEQL